MNDLEVDPVGWGRVLAVVFTLFAAITMVSSIPFYSFKTINFRRAVPFWAVLVIVLILVVVTSYPPLVLFSFFVVYSLSGYVMWLWNFRNKRSPF